MTNYRQLLDKEIATLTVFGCSAENWEDVQVAPDFSPNYIINVHFSGIVFLGTYNKVFHLPGGIKKHAGIYNCVLRNCVIENDVFIDKIHNYIANYQIGEGAYIENVNVLVVDGVSTFGNGTKVPVMIESGGREVPIFNQLSAPLAYMLTFYRHDKALVDRLELLIGGFAESLQADMGVVGKNARIVNCGTIKNVCIGNFALLEGAAHLVNGTIISNEQAPVTIGFGVQCTDFIIHSGATVTEAAQVSRCFIGQGCIIGKQFSAIDSLFFANCQGLHGEAVSIFAGPYTVTHHKSTLMLTALYSFMNAGSGSNFSNHMYKLGPVHQGVTERGVKTSSNSYIMWPAQIGAFTVVLGSHKGNPAISELPFSYLIENDGESNLLPGINLHSAGTRRDVQKWPKRDNRMDDVKLDSLNFDFLSPFTLFKAMEGIEILKGLLISMDAALSNAASFVWYQNCKLKRSSIKKGIELYEMAIDQFIGDKFIEKLSQKLGDAKAEDVTDLINLIAAKSELGTGQWVDMAGLLAPKSEVDNLLQRMGANQLTLIDIEQNISVLHANYTEYSNNWMAQVLTENYAKPISEFTRKDFVHIIEKWYRAVSTFNDLIVRDAKKEFNATARTGFGLDGSELNKQQDFDAVRGTMEHNLFIQEISTKQLSNMELKDKLILQLNG